MASELLYIYGPSNFKMPLEHVHKKHMYTIEADAYSTRKIEEQIWEEEWDKDLFCNRLGMNIFYT